MRRVLALVAVALLTAVLAPATRAEYPKPSPYPKSWELKFEHGTPKRVVVQPPNSNVPKAFWYMTYTVTNETDKEQLFLPAFELLTEDVRIVRNDLNIPRVVFETIKKREGIRYLTEAEQIGGELRLGPDHAKDGVAIWPEPSADMGHF